jgi:hypothetical protein
MQGSYLAKSSDELDELDELDGLAIGCVTKGKRQDRDRVDII